ncbi:MAG: hypothetical protein J6Y22_04605 [Paludibacteraceae bacterium]|nr:hypothetical protein [Paludibacteraceae bacterium]
MSIQQNFKRNVFIVLGLVIHACLFTNYCCAQDMSILQHSLDVMEKRRTEAYEEYSKLQVFLSDYQYRLNNDEETLQWFLNYKNSLFRTVEGFMNLGDYANARKYAVLYRGEVANNSELIARVQTAKEYKEKIKSIMESTHMDLQQKEDWIRNNPYCFIPIKNLGNEVIGGRLGSKAELEEQRRREEKLRLEMQLEEKRKSDLTVKLEKSRIRQMENPFDGFDYAIYGRIIDNPPVEKRHAHNIYVTKVAMSSEETRIELEFHYVDKRPKNEWCYLDGKTYIKGSGTGKLFLKKIENLESAKLFRDRGEKVKIALIFPPVPNKIKSFSLTPPSQAGWNISKVKCVDGGK